MSRRGGMLGGGDPLGSPAGSRVSSKKHWWIFAAVAGGLTAVWVILCLPRTENPDEPMPYTTKRAGWPDSFARWSVSNQTRQTTYSEFSTGAFLGDLVVLAIPITVAWVIIWQLKRRGGQTPDRADVRTRRTRGPAPSPGVPPSRRPPGSGQSSGGWG